MNGRRKLLVAGTGLVAAAVLVVGLFAADSSSPAPSAEGSTLDVPFVYLDGEEGNLSDFAGTPLVINFWASWCPPCLAEMPDFERVHSRLGDRVAFLGMNLQDDPAAARSMAEETGVTYPLGRDPDGSIFARFGGIGMPTTVFVDEEGAVVETHAGTLFADDLERVIRTRLLSS